MGHWSSIGKQNMDTKWYHKIWIWKQLEWSFWCTQVLHINICFDHDWWLSRRIATNRQFSSIIYSQYGAVFKQRLNLKNSIIQHASCLSEWLRTVWIHYIRQVVIRIWIRFIWQYAFWEKYHWKPVRDAIEYNC